MNSLAAPLTTKFGRRLATALAVAAVAVLPLTQAAPQARADSSAGTAGSGYWMVGSDGKVYPFGAAADLGSPALPAGAHATHIEPTPDGGGYYVLDDRGDVFAYGHAQSFGSAGLNGGESAVSLSATPSGKGYWIFTSAGRVITQGDAANLGDMSGKHLNAPVVSSTVTPDGSGYWMVAADGGVFSFGAPFWGSTGSLKLNKPVQGIVPTVSNKGYWLVASDGGVFAFGDAGFRGSMGATKLNKPVVGMVRYGNGYLMVGSDGGIFAFSDLPFQGSLGANPPAHPIVGTAPVPGGTTSTTQTTTAPTTPTTTQPGATIAAFSSTAKVTWGTPTDPSKKFTNRQGVDTFPYSQNVGAVAEIGNRVYIGGDFTDMVTPWVPGSQSGQQPSGVPMSYIAELDTTNGAPVPGSAFTSTVRLDGPVRSLLASPDGKRLYVGGEFQHVNGEVHRRLVALDPATGQIDRTFIPPEPNGYVASLLQYGSRLYIGGGFATLGGGNQLQLAALDAATGALDTGFVPPAHALGDFEGHTGKRADVPTTSTPYGIVDALAITGNGQYLMVGGTFLHFGYDDTTDPNHTHSGLIALDPTTGALTAWQPTWGSNASRPVFGMTVWPGDNNTLFTATGGAGGRMVTWTPGGATKVLWTGNFDGDVVDVAATTTMVYAVGHYDHVVVNPSDPCLKIDPTTGGVSCPFGLTHRHLVAMDPHGEIVNGKNTGKAVIDPNFNAQADTSEGPNTIFIGANQMYVGGNFSKVAAAPVANGNPEAKQGGFAMYPSL